MRVEHLLQVVGRVVDGIAGVAGYRGRTDPEKPEKPDCEVVSTDVPQAAATIEPTSATLTAPSVTAREPEDGATWFPP